MGENRDSAEGKNPCSPWRGGGKGLRLGVLRSVPASTEKGNVPRSSNGSEPLFNSERLLSFWSVLTSNYLNLAPQWNCWWRGCKRGRQSGREATVNLDTACCRCTGFEGLVYKRARLVAKSRQTAIPETVARQAALSVGDFPGKNTEVGCHFLHGIFPTLGSNPHPPALAGGSHWATREAPQRYLRAAFSTKENTDWERV